MNETTEQMLDKIDSVFEEYSSEDIDTEQLKKGMEELINNDSE